MNSLGTGITSVVPVFIIPGFCRRLAVMILCALTPNFLEIPYKVSRFLIIYEMSVVLPVIFVLPAGSCLGLSGCNDTTGGCIGLGARARASEKDGVRRITVAASSGGTSPFAAANRELKKGNSYEGVFICRYSVRLRTPVNITV